MVHVMPFNPLDYPLALAQPLMMTVDSAWIEHIPFAFALVEMARPASVVELGTFGGDSYCAFCQAVDEAKLPARCAAIDTWTGDQQQGFYGPEVLANLRGHHDARYSRFSRLIQSEFDGALGEFEDGSIDLLHIDGLHTNEAVKHDFETWRPKLSRAGIVLFHDTTDTSPGFGVHQLWGELSAQYRSFEFKHGSGLGVLAVGDTIPAAADDFLKSAKAQAEVVRTYFARLGERLSLLRIMMAVMQQVHAQQSLVNQWKRQLNEPVEPDSEQLQKAMDHPIGYATYAAGQVQNVLNADLDLRRKVGQVW